MMRELHRKFRTGDYVQGLEFVTFTVYARQVYVTILIRRHVVLKLGDEFEFPTVHVIFETREYTQCVVWRKCCSVLGRRLA